MDWSIPAVALGSFLGGLFVSSRVIAWGAGVVDVFGHPNRDRAGSFLARVFIHSGPWLLALAIAAVYYAASLPQPVALFGVLAGLCTPLLVLFAMVAIDHFLKRPTRDASGFLLASAIEEWRTTYRSGTTVTRFIANDIRRDVEVVDVSRISDGIVTARTRTWNVLYQAHNIRPQPDFGPVRDIEIERLWDWSGEPWGGPVPPDTDTRDSTRTSPTSKTGTVDGTNRRPY